jgi:DAHP synthetase I family
VDPSHSGGIPDLVLPLTRAAIAISADGVIIDVHPHPETALCDGSQALVDGDLRELAKIVRDSPHSSAEPSPSPRTPPWPDASPHPRQARHPAHSRRDHSFVERLRDHGGVGRSDMVSTMTYWHAVTPPPAS